MTAGVIIGAFGGDNIRNHHKQFLKIAIILLELIAEYPQQRRIDPTLKGWARF